jgi:protein TonB
LERNLSNPTEITEGEMIAVHVRFVVGYDGRLQKFIIVKDGGAIFNNEVLRVLKKMPQWIPGKSNGKNVAVYFTIPVKFVPAD